MSVYCMMCVIFGFYFRMYKKDVYLPEMTSITSIIRSGNVHRLYIDANFSMKIENRIQTLIIHQIKQISFNFRYI